LEYISLKKSKKFEMTNVKFLLIFLGFSVLFHQSLNAQQNYIDEAISQNRLSGGNYLAQIPEKAKLTKENVTSFCEGKYEVKNIMTSDVLSKGTVKKYVTSFEFTKIGSKPFVDVSPTKKQETNKATTATSSPTK
jgi:hypothetical protein